MTDFHGALDAHYDNEYDQYHHIGKYRLKVLDYDCDDGYYDEGDEDEAY